MLAESRHSKPGSPRHLRSGEEQLITQMVRGTRFEAQVLRDLAHALVEDMSDGGMGSIRFKAARRGKRLLGQQISEATFVDGDGIAVSATLNLDQHGELFELDLWKVDNSKLRRYPALESINVVAPAR
jgi:hypothetical protein